jgi:phospholipid/cholesterol/gamma-HCH transport system substrate-binding protein
MEARREQALVGIFVVVATAILVATLFAVGGAFGGQGVSYSAYFKNAGGLEPGSVVRYAGVKVGRVNQVHIDDKDLSRVVLVFSVDRGTPIRTDSVAKITSLSALGENYLEILPGKPESSPASAGAVLTSKEFFGVSELTDMLSDLSPDAKELVKNLKSRTAELAETIVRVNELLNAKNRENLAGLLDNSRGMIEENRPQLHSALKHVNDASAKLPALLDDLKKTMKQADEALDKLNGILGDNRDDLHTSITKLRELMASASQLIDQLGRNADVKAQNIDEILDNVRITTENLRQFTDTIKTRPSTLIRSSEPRERKPGQQPPP